MLKIVSQSVLVSALVAPVFGSDVDFDRGVDLTDFIGSAVGQAPAIPLLPAVDVTAAKPDAGKICNINFKAQPLELRAGDKFAQASYRINEKCELKLISVKYSQDMPAEAYEPFRQQPQFSGVSRGPNTCSENVWVKLREEKEIQAWNNTFWLTTPNDNAWNDEYIDISSVAVHAEAKKYKPYWQLKEPIDAEYALNEHLDVAHTYVNAAFSCTSAENCGGPAVKVHLVVKHDITNKGECKSKFDAIGSLPPNAVVGHDVKKIR